MLWTKIILILTTTYWISGCGTNFYGFLVFTKDDTEIMVLEEARNDLDNKKYTKAANRLDKLEEDSNEKSLLLASAHIGSSGLDLWSIIKNVIQDESIAPGSGIDTVFESLTASLFGAGEERISKKAGMRNAITTLLAAPDRSDPRIGNLGCFLAGLWSYPTLEDASAVLTALQSNLTTLNQEIANTGDCGSTDNLVNNVSDISLVSADIQMINLMISNCTLFSTNGTSSNLNSLERSLNKFTTNADGGCSPSACTGNAIICAALEESCVQQTFSTNASAGDGQIASCEILYGCSDSTVCF